MFLHKMVFGFLFPINHHYVGFNYCRHVINKVVTGFDKGSYLFPPHIFLHVFVIVEWIWDGSCRIDRPNEDLDRSHGLFCKLSFFISHGFLISKP